MPNPKTLKLHRIFASARSRLLVQQHAPSSTEPTTGPLPINPCQSHHLQRFHGCRCHAVSHSQRCVPSVVPDEPRLGGDRFPAQVRPAPGSAAMSRGGPEGGAAMILPRFPPRSGEVTRSAGQRDGFNRMDAGCWQWRPYPSPTDTLRLDQRCVMPRAIGIGSLLVVMVAFSGYQVAAEDVPTGAGAPVKWDIAKTNLVFLKVMKVGGSTVGGVMRRIAHHHGLEGVHESKYKNWTACETPSVWAGHATYNRLGRHVRNCRQSMPVFFVRNLRHADEGWLSRK